MKILIVDDEVCTRIELRALTDWDKYGYILAGEAYNGKHAIEQINLLNPDIVITDIKMPVMDGIALIRHFKAKPVCPRFIVLSGYNDFHLVKEAMKLGADDYLLKLELNENTIIKALQEVRQSIEKSGGSELQSRDHGLLENNREQTKEILNNMLIRNMLSNDYGLELYGSHSFFKNKSFCVLIIKNLDLHKVKRHVDKMNNESFVSCLIGMIDEIINDTYKGYCFEMESGKYCTAMWSDESDESLFIDEFMMSMIERLMDMIHVYFNINVFIAFGGIYKNYSGLCESHARALKNVEDRKIEGNSAYYQAIINKAKTYISEYYRNNLDLNEVANVVNLNPSYFSALFSNLTGASFKEYLTSIRMEKAKNLLQYTDYRICFIAEMTGYENAYYFSRVFKAYTGITPKQFKNMVMNNFQCE